MKLNKVISLIIVIVKYIPPPLITNAIERYKVARVCCSKRTCPTSQGVSIVREARQHVEQVTRASDTNEMPLSKVWTGFTERMRDAINTFATPQQAIRYAQSYVGFESRSPASRYRHYLSLYESKLINEFPYFSDAILDLDDSPYSDPATLIEYRGHLLSNICLHHFRSILQCLTHVKEPQVVCDIGCGCGCLARLWLRNSIFRPRCFVGIDLPESLFFAEVFLRVNFDDLRFLYVTSPEKLEPNVVSQYSVILCPIQFINAVSGLSFDLVTNRGSLQEMTEEWVDFWMQWLKERDCRWFYSLNYFAQPLDYMAEGANTWSPRLSPEWNVRIQTFNPALVRLYTPRNFAEILAEKGSRVSTVSEQTLLSWYQNTKDRILDGQVLLEALDIIRLGWDENIMWDLLLRCLTETRSIPKEAWWLANYLEKRASPEFNTRNGEELHKVYQKLGSIRSRGREDYHRRVCQNET